MQVAAGGQPAATTREQRWVLGLASLASFLAFGFWGFSGD